VVIAAGLVASEANAAANAANAVGLVASEANVVVAVAIWGE
jgi:hypothetical protein